MEQKDCELLHSSLVNRSPSFPSLLCALVLPGKLRWQLQIEGGGAGPGGTRLPNLLPILQLEWQIDFRLL